MTKKRSFFLMFALWVFVLLSLFCAGLGFRTFIQVKKTKLFLNSRRAFDLAVSGVKIAKQVLEKDFNADADKNNDNGFYVDHLQEEWAQPIEKEVEFSSPFKKGKLSVKIEDESGRFNINNIDDTNAVIDIKDGTTLIDTKNFKELFQEFFDKMEIDDASNKIDCILDYIDANDAYESRSPDSEKDAKNEKLSAPEELLLIKSISNEDYNKIKNFITVFGSDKKLNINTIKKELRNSLFDELLGSLAKEVEDVRNNKEYYYTEDSGNCPKTEEMTCKKLPMELPATLFKTKSNIFRVVSQGEVEGVSKKITCVLDRAEGKILYWYEE
ncbi:MAG: hypothetical protein ABIH08_05050 [Candidatus Omnitrophota bacterium]